MSEKILSIQNIEKKFGETQVLKGISLDIYKGEFVTFLGSSGCGKTTTLRIISGLEEPDQGTVILNGADVTTIEPNRRDVNTIFQNYALFPHMNVFQNVAYSLKLKKTPKEETIERVRKMLELVMLEGYEKRMPSELSGGQKQRVAIARALINNPSVLLLDEPLGALDLQLRRQMQQELKRLQKKLGITFIYITHDQEEAINMSDRIVVMNEGKFEQIGTPAEIYDHPKTSFVAKFIGTTNLLSGTVLEVQDTTALIQIGDATATIGCESYVLKQGQEVTFSIRSENVIATKEEKEGFTLKGRVQENTYVGGMLRIVFATETGREIHSTRQGIYQNVSLNDLVCISWKAEHSCLVDMEGTQ